MLRILHVGLGPLGVMITSDLIERRLGRIVAAVDVSPLLTGKHLRDAAPATGSDLPILASLDHVRDWSGVDAAVVTTSSDLAACAPTFRTLLSKGLPVVSTCEELLYPWLRHAALAEELDTLARKTGARLLGTGVNPGFLMDTLPVIASAVCKSIDTVEVHRIQDASPRRGPFQKKIGATLDDDGFKARVKDGSLRHVGLGESLHFIGRYLGMPVGRWEESIEPVHADRDLTCSLGPIPKGRIAGVRQIASGYPTQISPLPTIRLVFQAAIGQHDPHDRVVIHGKPNLDVTFKGGVHGDIATSAITLNSIRPLLAAPPGLHTMATIPLAHFARGDN